MDDPFKPALSDSDMEKLTMSVSALGVAFEDVMASLAYFQDNVPAFYDNFLKDVMKTETQKRKQFPFPTRRERGRLDKEKRRPLSVGFVQRTHRHQSR